MDHVLEARDLVKIYKSPWRRRPIVALNHLSLKVRPGEIFGLLGPNGSGKTTAMKAFLGLVRLDSGAVKLWGREPREMKVKSRIGYLPEESYFYKFLTARESLRFFGKLAGLSERTIRERMDEVFKMVGLHRDKDRWVRHFSKGMLRRLGFAFVLLKDPDLIFLDEPTVGLDPVGAREVREMMLGLAKRGKTIVLSSHLLGEIENVCDRVAIFYQGRVLKEDTLDRILEIAEKCELVLGETAPADLDGLRKKVQALGLKVESVGHPRKTLEQAFVEILAESPIPPPMNDR